jgi:hypothetical protein
MSRRRIALLILAAIGTAVAAGPLTGWWSWPGKKAPAEPLAERLIVPQNLDFGEVWATDRFDWNLPIQNATGSEVTLESLTGDCSCLSVDGLPLRVGGGEVGQLALRLDLTRRCMGVGPQPFAPIAHPIKLRGTVRLGETSHEVNWVLSGRVKPAVLFGRRGIDFGRLWNPSLPLDRSVTVRTAPGIHLAPADVEDSGKITAQLRPTVSAGEYELAVRLDQWAAPGRYHAAVRLVPVARPGESPGVVRFPVEWESLDEIQTDTATLEFGAQPVGSTREQTLTLTSLAGRPFRVTKCETGSGMQTEPPPSEPATSITLRLMQRVECPGEQTGELAVWCVTAAGEAHVVKCRMHYVGVSSTGQ